MKLSIFVALVCLAVAASGQTPPPSPEPKPSPSAPPPNYDLRWGVKIPMRDKVELNATLYLPARSSLGEGGPQTNAADTAATAKTPFIFTLTPYISDSYHPRAAYFASHGYAFALVDVRGRGNSGADFQPSAQQPRA